MAEAERQAISNEPRGFPCYPQQRRPGKRFPACWNTDHAHYACAIAPHCAVLDFGRNHARAYDGRVWLGIYANRPPVQRI